MPRSSPAYWAVGSPTESHALSRTQEGPATNFATIGALYRTLGGPLLAIYLGTVIVASIAFGMGFDFVLGEFSDATASHVHDAGAWWKTGSALLLVGLLVFLSVRRLARPGKAVRTAADQADLKLQVTRMSCSSRAANVRAVLERRGQVDSVAVDLGTGSRKGQG